MNINTTAPAGSSTIPTGPQPTGQIINNTSTVTQSNTTIISNTANVQPHNNMPPYIVLKVCKKIKDYSIAFNVTEELTKLKSEISNQQEILKSSLNMTTELQKYKSEIESQKTSMKE